MIAEFKLPDLGEGLTESEIVSWRVAVGDSVTLNQVIGEVETAKAVVELPSPFAGVVTAITHEPGTMVEVGEVIIAFDVPEQAVAPDADEPAAKRVPTLVGYGADPETSSAPVRRQRVFASVPSVGSAPVASTPADQGVSGRVQGDRPRSTPPVRKLARDLGIELAMLAGSGERGLITRQDVVSFAGTNALGEGKTEEGAPSNIPAGAQGAADREVRTPVKGVRKFMAQAMVASAFTAPHVTEFLTLDVTAGMDFLAKLRSQKEFAGVKVTPLTLVAKAVNLAIARHPALNSHWDEARQEIVTFNYVNLGIAAATPRGLVVPNIKDAHTLGLHGLAVALGGLADTARAGKTQPAELAGGTFSITNIGVFGIDAGTPILNPGEAGILAMGAVRTTPWEYQGAVALRQVMTLSLSFDHRLVDGEQGSRFLADVGAVMADPAMALVLG
ncbi:pyruvate dehydrogenase E2 component (dihydrolipoamide acetyltransferase) [Arthrobacter alpinus]|uniref:Dihydrolipoamide acetyltransferase component of pyruvate dehydrogenase complex n=1 Tax=Arthrobacter alpinus TaxID=656366 RepID=A0A1H5K0F0_9MICC|nr:dihydrolipoamide acetyltransferase family protein [Arthrobacter alpinus]SEE58170.1 pyruvate dehydrogenase E2 component (dihydrolipoamide acetyltransferase) [Arthrobacter alpinus]